MTDLAIRPMTTAPSSPGPEVGVSSTTAYLSSPHCAERSVTLGPTVPEWYRDWLERALNRLRALPAGWDGYSAKPITDEAVTGMVSCLIEVLQVGHLAPQLVPLPDGGIQADWLVADSSLEIEVRGDGASSVFGSDHDGTVVIDGDADWSTLPAAAWRLGRLTARAAARD